MTTVEISIGLVAILVSILMAVLGIYGALIKAIYEKTNSIDHLLRGTDGDTGFAEQIRESQERTEDSLDAHSALLQEMVYVIVETTEVEGTDIDTRRLEYLEEFFKEQVGVQEHPEYQSKDETPEEAGDEEFEENG